MATVKNQLRGWLWAGGITCVGLAGCGKAPNADQAATPAVAVAPADAERPGDPHVAAKPAVVSFNDRFDTAVITEVLDGHHLPPDLTFAGLKTGNLRAAIEQIWPSIKVTDAAGQPVVQIIKMETSEGVVEISLRPDLAPNHVRNMLALTKLGFYNGLRFESNVRQEADIDGQKSRLDLLIAGCPTGTGDAGFGHLGYFVRAEFQPDLKHEAGTVGFWHEEDPDSAGTRFYITLGPAPALDGKFTIVGQVSKGLDVMQRIASQPVKSTDPSSPDSEKPITPASIKKVTIATDSIKN